jgi:hypothetical protein
MEDLQSLIHSLGLEYIRQPDGFILTQRGYAAQILAEFGLEMQSYNFSHDQIFTFPKRHGQ